MGYQVAKEQIPVLCKACGGTCTVKDTLDLVCDYCGTPDRLPEVEIDRVLELKRRVQKAAASVAQLDGFAAALAHVFEDRRAFFRAAAPWILVAVVVTVGQIVSSRPAIAAAPPELRAGLMVYAAMGSLMVSGIVLAIFVSLFLGRATYRKNVRPHLFARPPRQEGAPARCRGCGADLPDQRGPFITCAFCRTRSLVTPEIQANRQQLLDAEERQHRQHGAALSAKTALSSRQMTRVMIIGIVLSYGAMFAVAKIGSALITR